MEDKEIRKVEVEYVSDFQYKALSALAQSFQDEGVNFDKFLFWALKETKDGGSSMCLRKLLSTNET